MEEDKRFQHVLTDPKFRRIPKGERKVKIDKRFKSMFKDKRFKLKYTIDKRGKPINHSTSEDLKRYYDLSSGEEDEEENEKKSSEDESSDSEEDQQENVEDKQENVEDKQENDEDKQENYEDKQENEESSTKVKEKETNSNNFSTKLVSDKVIPDKVKKRLKNLNVDYARGEGTLLSDSSSDDDEEEEDIKHQDEEEDKFDHKWGELDNDAERTDEITSRLAACNMDWDRIRALDLMVLFNSFVPSGGAIKSVIIYPSEFGRQRMAEEEIKGPIELVEKHDGENDNEEDNTEGSKYHMEKLRKYQLNRLKYYYAVIICDSANTANKIYTECDGMEYESTATKIDLRFIPDDVTFDQDEPKEVCDKMPDSSRYKPRYFTTTALQQAKVDLTWDETNPDRLEITQKLASGKVDDITDIDLHNYLASSSSESENDEDEAKKSPNDEEEVADDNPLEKYKLLLQEIESKEKEKEKKDIGMEISWGIELQQKTEKLMKQKKDSKDQKTPFEQLLEKRKAKRKEKREGKKKQEDESESDDAPSDIDMNDPYFAEEFNKAEFKKPNKKNKPKDSDVDTEDEEETQRRHQQLALLLNDDEDDGKHHFSLKKIQDQENDSKNKKKLKKLKKKKNNFEEEKEKPQDNFEVKVDDDRFSALYTSHHYNIDPTDPHFKKTKNMDKIIDEKLKRRAQSDDSHQNAGGSVSKKAKVAENGQKLNAELNVLVKSVKRKTETFRNRK